MPFVKEIPDHDTFIIEAKINSPMLPDLTDS